MKLSYLPKLFLQKYKNIFKIYRLKRGGNIIQVHKSAISKININVQGQNNRIIIDTLQSTKSTRIYINICGNNNIVKIGNISLSGKLEIIMGQSHYNFGPISNSSFIAYNNTSIESLEYITCNSNAKCSIGHDCMLSYSITIYNTDAHAILDYSTKQLVNFVDAVTIGDHVWIGRNVTIMRNTTIPDDCIIGSNSVVAGKLQSIHAIYAGNPAKLVKENRTWNANGNKFGYIKNIIF